MSSVLRLKIHLRVPIAIKKDNSIGSLQIQAQPTSTSAQQKDVILRVSLVEHLCPLASIICLSAAVQPQVLDAPVVEIYLHDVHEMRHLGENEQAMVEQLELRQHPVDQLKLPRRPENPIMVGDVIVVF